MAIVNELVTKLSFSLEQGALEAIHKFGEGMEKIVNLSEKVGKYATVMKGLFDFVTVQTAGYAKELYNFGLNTGISTEALQKWEYVAKSAGVSVEGLKNDIVKMHTELHLTDQQMLEWADHLKNMPIEDAKVFARQQGLSDNFLTLARRGGSQGIIDLFRQVERTGLTLTEKQVQDLDRLDTKWQQLITTLDMAKKKVASELGPVFEEQLNTLTGWLEENNFFVEQLTWLGTVLAAGFSIFFDVLGDIAELIKDITKPIFGDWAKELDTANIAAKGIAGALLIITSAKVLNGIAFIGKMLGLGGLFTAGGAAAGAAGGSAAGAAAAGAAGGSIMGGAAGLAGIIGGGWMIGEEIANIQNKGPEQYNWLERLVKPISEFIVGGELGDYRITNGNKPVQQITNHTTFNINASTVSAGRVIIEGIKSFMSGNGNGVAAQ